VTAKNALWQDPDALIELAEEIRKKKQMGNSLGQY